MKLSSSLHSKFLLTMVSTTLLASSFLLSGCSDEVMTKQSDTTDTAVSETEVSPLLVYGEVKVDETREMQIDFPAKVTQMTIKDGTIVNKGDHLVTLDFEDYKLTIATLEKQLEGYELEMQGLQGSANATAASLDAISKELALKKGYSASGQDPDILPLQNSLVTLNNDLKEAEALYAANCELLDEGAISQTEVNQNKIACEKLRDQIASINTSIAKAEDARALEISALQSKLKATSLEVGNIDTSKAAKLDQLQVQIESTTLTLQNMKAKLSAAYLDTNKLVADSDHLLIYDISITPGSSISGLGQPLFKMMNLDTLYVIVDIPEESLSQVTIGDTVTLKTADKNVTTPILGTISRISDYATEKDGDTVVEAFITVDSGKEILKPGLSIDAYID